MVFEHHLFKIKKDCDTNFVTTFKCIPRAKKLSEEIQFWLFIVFLCSASLLKAHIGQSIHYTHDLIFSRTCFFCRIFYLFCVNSNNKFPIHRHVSTVVDQNKQFVLIIVCTGIFPYVKAVFSEGISRFTTVFPLNSWNVTS